MKPLKGKVHKESFKIQEIFYYPGDYWIYDQMRYCLYSIWPSCVGITDNVVALGMPNGLRYLPGE